MLYNLSKLVSSYPFKVMHCSAVCGRRNKCRHRYQEVGKSISKDSCGHTRTADRFAWEQQLEAETSEFEHFDLWRSWQTAWYGIQVSLINNALPWLYNLHIVHSQKLTFICTWQYYRPTVQAPSCNNCYSKSDANERGRMNQLSGATCAYLRNHQYWAPMLDGLDVL